MISKHTWKLTFAMGVTIAWTNGCALNRPFPEKSQYLPNVPIPEKREANSAALTYRIKVRNAKVDAPFEGKTFVYRLEGNRWETDFYHEWFTYPRDILTEAAVDYLNHAGNLGLISTEDSLVKADFYLEGTLKSLYLDRRNQEALTSVIKTRWYLIPQKTLDDSKERRELWTNEYVHRAPCHTDTPQAYAESTAQALALTFETLNADLTAVLQEDHKP